MYEQFMMVMNGMGFMEVVQFAIVVSLVLFVVFRVIDRT